MTFAGFTGDSGTLGFEDSASSQPVGGAAVWNDLDSDLMIIIFALVALLEVVTCNRCSRAYEHHPLVLVSLDGFRADYLTRGLTPNILALKERGTSSPYMRASNPTITFPNHYTIVTGLYPESHGIIDNSFYDPTFHASFNLGSEESRKGRWWGGEPIWNTVVKQGKLSAAMYWPGSDADIQGMHPTYYHVYDNDDLLPYSRRIDQVLLWLSFPVRKRPTFISVYFDQPDHSGHGYGPDSPEVNDNIQEVDTMIGKLVKGIANLRLTDCVNIMVVSDHGMAKTGEEGLIDLADFAPHIDDFGVTYGGAFVRIDLFNKDEKLRDEIRKNLTCQEPEFRQYTQSSLPTRFHYSNNDRIGDIIVDLNVGQEGTANSNFYLQGNHGYDNYYKQMEPIFMADGPAFRKRTEVEPFQNIEIYNLLCHLVGVIPALNNGTQASLYHLLQDPPPYPTLRKEVPPPSPPFPSDEEIFDRQHISGCPGDDHSPLDLNFTPEEERKIEENHVPWGVPYSSDLPADLLLLHQEDHVTGYSQQLKMPLWTSFTLNHLPSEALTAEWSSDVRLTSQNTPTCQSYDHLSPFNVTMQPLFPNKFRSDSESDTVPFVVSNGVPMTSSLLPRWHYLTEGLLPQWLTEGHAPINVIVGPLFDKDANSLVDDFTQFKLTPKLPSDLFMILTRCQVPCGDSISACPHQQLDSTAFIYPQIDDIPNCMGKNDYALKFSAKVHDVELATGLTFFPTLSSQDRLTIILRIHAQLWPISSS